MASNATHTRAEKINFSRTDDLRNFCAAPSYTAQRTPGVSAPLGYLDTYGSTLDQDFGLDLPVFAALLTCSTPLLYFSGGALTSIGFENTLGTLVFWVNKCCCV